MAEGELGVVRWAILKSHWRLGPAGHWKQRKARQNKCRHRRVMNAIIDKDLVRQRAWCKICSVKEMLYPN